MAFKAVKSFSGVINMKKGDVKEIEDNKVAEDLVRVGYVEEVEKEEEKKPVAKRGRRKKEAQENAD